MAHKVDESPVEQSKNEEIAYEFDFTSIGTPTSPAVTIKDMNAGGADVSATCLTTGTPAIAGNVVTTTKIKSLVTGRRYHLECVVTISGNLVEAYCDIFGTD